MKALILSLVYKIKKVLLKLLDFFNEFDNTYTSLIKLLIRIYLFLVFNFFFLFIIIFFSFLSFFFIRRYLKEIEREYANPYHILAMEQNSWWDYEKGKWIRCKGEDYRRIWTSPMWPFWFELDEDDWVYQIYNRRKNENVISLFLILFSFFFYCNFLFYNIFNFFIVWFYKKNKFINFNLDLIVSFDFINLYFIILTNFIFFMIYITFFNTKFKNDLYNYKTKLTVFLFILIELSLILTFSTSNIFFFFFFFECSLIPMYLLIQLSGKGLKKKQYAALSLVFFTLTGSIFLLFAILYIISICNSCDFKHLNFEFIDFNSQLFIFIIFFIGFSVKVPIFPFYSWLPEAHVEASTAISILLAAIFLKIATYAFLKIIVFNFFLITLYYYSLIFYFSIISILVATFLTLIQTDLKKIVALSSIIHMNYMVIAIFTLDPKAILGSFIYMLSHAFISAALFFLIGVLYENTGTRDLLNFSNFYKYNSKLYFFFFFFNLANVSFPLLMSFISEIIILNNMLYYNIFIIILILISIFFSIIYTFWMIHNIFFSKNLFKKNYFLLSKFDVIFLLFLFIIVVVLGIIPSIILYNLEQELYLILINKLNIF